MYNNLKTTLKFLLPKHLVRFISYIKNYFLWKCALLAVFYCKPEFLFLLYKLRDKNLIKYVIAPDKRLVKPKHYSEDFDFLYSGEYLFEEINVVMRGKSFNSSAPIDESLLSFLVNWQQVDSRFSLGIGITADSEVYKEMQILGISPLLMVNPDFNPLQEDEVSINTSFPTANSEIEPGKIEKFKHTQFSQFLSEDKLEQLQRCLVFSRKLKAPQLSMGSGLCVIMALSRVAKNINIYGWDEYINESIEDRSHLRVLWSLGGNQSLRSPIALFKKFCSQLLVWNYVNMLINEKRFKISSHLSNTGKHPAITNRVHRFIYK